MTPPPLDPEHVNRAILLLANGATEGEAGAVLSKALQLDRGAAGRLLAEARAKITMAGRFDPRQEAGRAYVRLNDLYRRCVSIHDTKTALSAQRELNKLIALYLPPRADAPAAPVDPTAGAVALYLHPLQLAPATAPPVEHIRLAAQRIIDAPPPPQPRTSNGTHDARRVSRTRTRDAPSPA
jgi:hypothetical protein